ncbi:Uncharacterized multiple-sugar transport system permease YteP, partial [Geodia barretti]
TRLVRHDGPAAGILPRLPLSADGRHHRCFQGLPDRQGRLRQRLGGPQVVHPVLRVVLLLAADAQHPADQLLHDCLRLPGADHLRLMLNEMKVLPLKRIAQTVSYLPYCVSLVIIVGMLVTFLSPNNGIINIIIKSLGGEAVNFMGQQSWFRPLYIGSHVWQWFGFSSIIYLAAIAGVSQELYDAAEVDGASRLQRIRFVTIPGMAPTIIILLILNLGHALSVNWEKNLLMYTPATYEVADVIDTYVYRRGIVSGEYSFGAAVGLFKNVVNLGLLVVFNRLARRFTDTSLW